MDPEFEFVSHEMAKSIANTRELLEPLDEAALGYRKHLESVGWSPQIAEKMAAEFYTLQIRALSTAFGRS